MMEEYGKRLRDVIDSIDYYELLRIKKDLQTGGNHLKKFVNEEISRREKLHSIICSNCGSQIDPYSNATITLMFGPHDFKKKATFCGKDCMQYFMTHLDAAKNHAHTKSE